MCERETPQTDSNKSKKLLWDDDTLAEKIKYGRITAGKILKNPTPMRLLGLGVLAGAVVKDFVKQPGVKSGLLEVALLSTPVVGEGAAALELYKGETLISKRKLGKASRLIRLAAIGAPIALLAALEEAEEAEELWGMISAVDKVLDGTQRVNQIAADESLQAADLSEAA